MVIVVSANPAIDVRMELTRLQPGHLHRVQAQNAFPGGKGWHVARTVHILGGKVLLTGFTAGPEGAWIAEQAQLLSIRTDFCFIPGHTRRCLAIFEKTGRVTEILEKGPQVGPLEIKALLQKVEELLPRAGMLVLSGSLPPGAPRNFYSQLIRRAKSFSVRSLLDTSGAWLSEAIRAAPFAVKPNLDELKMVQGGSSKTADAQGFEIEASLRWIQALGIELPMVSLGAGGLVFMWGQLMGRLVPPHLPEVNPVGSGDCLIGGLAEGLSRGLEPLEALRQGVACAAANVLTSETGCFRVEDYRRLFKEIRLDWRLAAES